MREYHRTHQWRLSDGALYIPHAYWNMEEDSLSYWDDVGFILNGRRIIVWWEHPRNIYRRGISTAAWKEVGKGPRDNWLSEGVIKNYKMVGKSKKRKKLASYINHGPSDAMRQHYRKLQQTEERLVREGIELTVQPSWKWERLSWAMGVSLVAPVEVRNEQELADVARLARELILQKTTLAREFPGYVYTRESWLRDQAFRTVTLAADGRDVSAPGDATVPTKS